MIRSVLSRRATVATTGVAALAGAAMAAAFTAGPAAAAPASGTVLAAANPIAGSYVVVLKDAKATPGAVKSAARDLAGRHSGAVTYTYTAAIRGFAVKMTEAQAKRLAADPRVASVQQDGVVKLAATQSPATWGLDRIDQRSLPLDNSYTYSTTASNVHAYIIDTGIRTAHSDFGGRATVGTDTIGDGQNGQDCNGHGTHVAGTVGGATYGVAKGVSLVAVRVLNCSGSGTNAGVIAGIDWVTANAIKPAVANMSLGGGAYAPLDTAVTQLDHLRRHLRAGRRQQQRERLQLLAGPHRGRDHRRRHHQHRRPRLVLQLRHLPGHLRAGPEHHLGLEHQQHGDQHDQRHLDGVAARRRRRGALPGGQPDRHGRRGPQRAGRRGHPQRGRQPGHRLAEPAALHRHRHHAAAGRADLHQRHRRLDPGRRRRR